MPEGRNIREDAPDLTCPAMININEVIETNLMIEKENLDVRTITVGINLLDCASGNVDQVCSNIKSKIIRTAGKLAETAENISMEYGIPIVNKRISITPISLVGASACKSPQDYVVLSTVLQLLSSRRILSGRGKKH